MLDVSGCVRRHELLGGCKGVLDELKEVLCAVYDEVGSQTPKSFWNCALCFGHVVLLAGLQSARILPCSTVPRIVKNLPGPLALHAMGRWLWWRGKSV